MQSRNLTKIVMALVGLGFALVGALNLWISSTGDFSQGREIVTIAGGIFLVIAAPFLAFPFSRKISKVLGAIVLLAFSAAMVWLAFRASNPAAYPWSYQIGAIALALLLVARIPLVLRTKRAQAGT